MWGTIQAKTGTNNVVSLESSSVGGWVVQVTVSHAVGPLSQPAARPPLALALQVRAGGAAPAGRGRTGTGSHGVTGPGTVTLRLSRVTLELLRNCHGHGHGRASVQPQPELIIRVGCKLRNFTSSSLT